MRYTILLLFTAINFLYAQQNRITFNPVFKPFYHGVASGDPMPDKVIIWARATPDSGNTAATLVYWQVATDPTFSQVVNYGKSLATEQEDYTVKVDVCGLQPNQFYYYMFSDGVKNSIVGRTKTAPAENADADSVRFAVVSCASWEHGFYNAYQHISDRNDVDAVIHLGDYIYEYGEGEYGTAGNNRLHYPEDEILSKEQYQLRYSQYRLDDQLKRVHQLFPFINVWDDHESSNDAWREGAENHTPGTEGPWDVRKRNATTTFFRWIPIRKPDLNDSIRIFRRLRYGKLLDLIMIDTRLYDRDEQNASLSNDPNHKLLGPVERTWLLQQLSDSTTRWKIIGNQVMFAPMKAFGLSLNNDQWDGYEWERNQIINHVRNNNINNMVVLTGDIHTSWCNDIPGPNYNGNTGAGSVGVEFVGTSVTSANFPLAVGQNVIMSFNPHMKYVNLNENGHMLIDVRKSRVVADYKFTQVDQLGRPMTNGPSYRVDNNTNKLTATVPVPANPFQVPIPSALPNHSIPLTKILSTISANVDNKSNHSIQVLPNASVCPALSPTILVNSSNGTSATNGGNINYTSNPFYVGYDTVVIQYCQTSFPFMCDTVLVVIQVLNKSFNDTIYVNLKSNQQYNDCASFDDINTPINIQTYAGSNYQYSVTNDSCFILTADSNFCGASTWLISGCDANGSCDTAVYNIQINGTSKAATQFVNVPKNTIINQCFSFDDLIGTKGSNQLILLPKNGNFSFTSDSCFRFSPFYNFIGSDTLSIVSCDQCTQPLCDTIHYVISFNTTGIVDDKMVVLGVYPNPIDDFIAIQYFMIEQGEISVELLNNEGKRVVKQLHKARLHDVSQATINTSTLPSGTYLLKVIQGKQVYTKTIVKK